MSSRPTLLALDLTLSVRVPAFEIPERSPFTSAQKTGTPTAENDSASTCSVTVLPVPVAPVISPWRLAYFSQIYSFLSPVPCFG